MRLSHDKNLEHVSIKTRRRFLDFVWVEGTIFVRVLESVIVLTLAGGKADLVK
jgi:hypothetical protein